MSDVRTEGAPIAPPVPVVPIPQLLPWALFVGLLALMTLYLVGVEEGAAAVTSGGVVHEYLHDARHLLGFPCH